MKQLCCATYEGIEARKVTVEATLTRGLPSFTIVGMANTAIAESKERVNRQTQLYNVKGRCTINRRGS